MAWLWNAVSGFKKNNISSEDLDSYWIILLQNHINSLLKQNVKNIDFKFASSKSLEAIFKRNDLNLIETFFKNEISETPDLEAINKFINKPDEFYSQINFSECFEIIHENNNEKMAIYLFKIFKYIYLRNNKDKSQTQKEFSINFHLDVKKIFDKNWMNLFELILNDLNDVDLNQINKPDEFYLQINFSECFEIIKENNNEKMAISLFKIFKSIYLRNNKDETNISKLQREFSNNFQSNVKEIFDKNAIGCQ